MQYRNMDNRFYGRDQGIRWFFNVPERARKNAAKGLTLGAEHLKGEADKTCPRMDGILAGSANVAPATAADLEAHMGYGGDASAYVLYQHEHDDLDHSKSKNPNARGHWLLLTCQEQKEKIVALVAKTISGGWR